MNCRLMAASAILGLVTGCATELPRSASSAHTVTYGNEVMDTESNDAFKADRNLPCNVIANCSCC